MDKARREARRSSIVRQRGNSRKSGAGSVSLDQRTICDDARVIERVFVESRWWQDDPVTRNLPSIGEVTDEGWLVVRFGRGPTLPLSMRRPVQSVFVCTRSNPTTGTSMTWIIWLGVALGTIAAAITGLSVYGAARWADSTRRLLLRLESTRLPATTSRYDAHELEGLPAPVKRYFRAVLKDSQAVISAATVEHIGTFNLKLPGEQWIPFTSKQRVVTRRSGFVWNARIAMFPGIAVYVHDAYVGGEGILNPAILGLFSLAGQIEPRVLAQGEFVRFFAEAAWYPTALLPRQRVVWESVDDRSAKATLVDGALSVTMLVRFNEADLIESVRVEARAAVVGKDSVMTPWEARMSNYQVRDGILVPLTGEASWLRVDGRKPYWRGTITSLTYEFSNS